ncbi:hypothetical protein ACFONL_01450 [Camelimonas fluminis]|uniref:Uncharacterized protein n=1 Tax=Camelimonas fluminis TaxID=1576911 RepID=A0ABV7UBN4_9HYPH|nr:hypothetical protein [Camelimonas fluminis]
MTTEQIFANLILPAAIAAIGWTGVLLHQVSSVRSRISNGQLPQGTAALSFADKAISTVIFAVFATSLAFVVANWGS